MTDKEQEKKVLELRKIIEDAPKQINKFIEMSLRPPVIFTEEQIKEILAFDENRKKGSDMK